MVLRVFDLLGREVGTLVRETKEAGEYSAQFDAAGIASGMYLCRLEVFPAAGGEDAPGYAATRKLLFEK